MGRGLHQANARELVAAAKAALPHFEAALSPAGPEKVRLVLQPLALIFSVRPGRSERAWEAIAGEYFSALQEFPLDALIRAKEAYRNDGGSIYFPLPGQLRALAKTALEDLYIARYRCKLLAEAEQRAAPREPTPEEIEARKKMADETLALLKAKKPPNPLRPSESPAEVAARLRAAAKPAASGNTESELFS